VNYVSDVLNFLESIAPVRWAYSFDNVGLLIGNRTDKVTGIVFALDLTHRTIQAAIDAKASVIITHHPVMFSPIKRLTTGTEEGTLMLKLIQNGISHIAMHTNWDAAPGGINDVLAGLLGLEHIQPFGSGAEVDYSKIVVFAPLTETEIIIDAMANAGAGNIGNYRRCAFKSAGLGTYDALKGSNPAIGRVGTTVEVEENRIEMLVRTKDVNSVIEAMRAVHTYEQPAFDVLTLRPLVEQPVGRIGTLPKPMTQSELMALCAEQLGCPAWNWGDSEQMVHTVAVCGGSADDEWQAALHSGADAFITGEVKHHIGLEATAKGMVILAAGHYATENPGMKAMATLFPAEITTFCD
jgi:dinuclear metal center YbgI/SA1388 family protein